MSSRSTKSTHVYDDAIPEQNTIDRPVDVSFAPDFAKMHAFMLGQHPGVAQSGGDYAVCGLGRSVTPLLSGAMGFRAPDLYGSCFRPALQAKRSLGERRRGGRPIRCSRSSATAASHCDSKLDYVEMRASRWAARESPAPPAR